MLGALLFLLGNFFLNLWVVPRLKPTAPPENAPFVSILVPARNEEAVIERCLRSLQLQNYPGFEIILLDDGSTDATAEIARHLGFSEANGQFRLIAGTPLPAGWVGKPWACHQLSAAARGDYFLFTDADTDHAPASLSAAMKVAVNSRTDLLTLWPFQETATWSEKWIIQLLFIAAAGALPHWLFELAHRRAGFRRIIPARIWKMFGAANGQYVLFRREAYERNNGHRAVAAAMVEDMSLGRIFANQTPAGTVLKHVDGIDVVRTRMYQNFPQLWEGFTKNAWPAFDGRIEVFAVGLALQCLIFVGPFAVLPFAKNEAGLFFLGEIGLIYLMRAVFAWRFRSSWWGVLAHPLAYLLATAIALNSYLQSHRGGVSWKGRVYRVGNGKPKSV